MTSENNKKPDHDDELRSNYDTPKKLSLPTILTRPGFSSEAPTPPPRTTVISIPFKWEEAPGKPRSCHTRPELREREVNNVVRALELPPRLLSLERESTGNIYAPSPTTVLEGPYVGRAVSFTTSYRDNNNKDSVNFGSSRWGGLKKNNRIDREGSFDFSSWSVEGGDKVKITRVKRRGSFSHGTSHFWASIYGSFKQVVPWRRKQEKQQN
ncbi:hypothetical protein MtrunA17_Chr1g0146921 [Medicago truncatula]|uniref:Uncharacterized protein n=1 Tax=Medicago truncatula TaxID=3880 RepID=A0A072VE41_MEDTR|nr:uncharacterized protein At4g00950 [Medicago truncatula]KEH39728.1 hypothetical protein MTR_1g007905 [Medicago truncatula]RHN76715.1 hypothetical protein MtrunA17_Chr1g0146921 [Medicago truncatula]